MLRKSALVALAVLVAGAAFFALRPTRTIGQGPAGPAVSRAAFENPWTTKQLKLVGLGDSVTAGFGAKPGLSYFERLVSNPPDEFADMKGINLSRVLPNLTASNLTVSGSTSLDHVRHIEKLGKSTPDVLGLVEITTGGNDLIHNYGRSVPQEGAMYRASMQQAEPWIGAFRKRLETMRAMIVERFPGGFHIFIANIYDPTDGVGDIENAGLPPWKDGLQIHAAYNDALRAFSVGHDDVHLVDMYGAFLGHGIHCHQGRSEHYRPDDPHYWYFTNLEDPNDRGYDAIRRLFLLEMKKVLFDGSGK